MKTSERIFTIKKLLAQQGFGSHEELLRALEAEGCKTNQATVSRDFKKLNIIKSNGIYKLPPLLSEIATSLIQQVVLAGDSLVIVRTTAGAANAAAVQIEQLKLETIIGTIAGDDTIFIATPNRTAQKYTLTHILGLIK